MPGCWTQLRLFEPRYLGMMAKISSQEQQFLMCLPFDNPQQQPKGVLVRVTDFDPEVDGKLLIQIRGEGFYRLEQLEQDESSLWWAQAKPLHDLDDAWRPDMPAKVDQLYQGLRQHPDLLSLVLPAEINSEQALNWLVTLLPFDATDRQLLLNCQSSAQRAELITRWVQLQD